MGRRLLAFFVAFSVVGGPLAIEVCEATCATHVGMAGHSTASPLHRHDSADAMALHHHHHGSEVQVTPTADHAALTMAPHICSDLAVVAESRTPTRASVVAVDANGTPTARLLLAPAVSLSAIDSRHSPPSPIRSSLSLRI